MKDENKRDPVWIELEKQVYKQAKRLGVEPELIIALYRLGQNKILPIIRSDVAKEEIMALLGSLILREQEEKVYRIRWGEIFYTLFSKMDEEQVRSFFDHRNDSDKYH